MRSRLVTAGLVVPLLAVVLVGCSEEPEPKFADSGPSDEPSTSESTSEPTSSPTSQEPQTAKEFIRRWSAASTEMQNTGATREYLAMVTENCGTCQSLATQVEKYYSDGGFIRTKGWRIKEMRLEPREKGVRTVIVDVESRPTTYSVSSDASQAKLDGGDVTYRVRLVRRGESWRVGAVSEDLSS